MAHEVGRVLAPDSPYPAAFEQRHANAGDARLPARDGTGFVAQAGRNTQPQRHRPPKQERRRARSSRREGRSPRSLRLLRPSASPGLLVASCLSRSTVFRPRLTSTHRLTLPLAASEPCSDALGATSGLLLSHPAGERHKHILDCLRAIQPRLVNTDDGAGALTEEAQDPQHPFCTLPSDAIECPHDHHLELTSPGLIEGELQRALVLATVLAPVPG